MALNTPLRTGFLPSVFDDLLSPIDRWLEGKSPFPRMATIPPVNITEAPSAYQLSLAVPGLSKDDLAIRLDRNLLTVSAEKETKTENKEEKATRSEYNYSSFSRSFTLPEDVRQESITATYENGVLKLDLPRLEGQTNGSARDISIS